MIRLITLLFFLVSLSFINAQENFYNLDSFETLFDTTKYYDSSPLEWSKTPIPINLHDIQYYKPLPRQTTNNGQLKFTIDDNSFSFTWAQEPEVFSNYSRMTWKNSEDTLVFPLMPISYLNIIGLWKIENYLVFAIHADGEYGDIVSGLGFWDLITGNFFHYYAYTRITIKYDGPPNLKPQNDPTSKFMNKIFTKDIGFNNDLFVIKSDSDSLMVLNPQNKNWYIFGGAN